MRANSAAGFSRPFRCFGALIRDECLARPMVQDEPGIDARIVATFRSVPRARIELATHGSSGHVPSEMRIRA